MARKSIALPGGKSKIASKFKIEGWLHIINLYTILFVIWGMSDYDEYDYQEYQY